MLHLSRTCCWTSASSCLKLWAAAGSTSSRVHSGFALRTLDSISFASSHINYYELIKICLKTCRIRFLRSVTDILDLAVGLGLVCCGILNVIMHFGGES